MYTVYRKLDFVEANKHKILQLAKNKQKLDSYHPKTNPKSNSKGQRITIRVPFKTNASEFVSIGEVAQFAMFRQCLNRLWTVC